MQQETALYFVFTSSTPPVENFVQNRADKKGS